MEEFFTRAWTNLIGRIHGTMSGRLLIQPLIACIFAVHAGLRDYRENKPPFFWAMFFDPEHRRAMLRQGWKDIGKVFIVAVILDIVYQFVVFSSRYPGEAIIVAVLLAIIPYVVVRAAVTRVAGWRKKRL